MAQSPPPPLHFLITAGPTREKIDDVRDWGNIFTGQTGLDLARALVDLGNVTLLTSNAQHARDVDGFSGSGGMIGTEMFRSHADLLALLHERMTSGDRVDAVAMTAAVADYTPAAVYRILERRPDSTATPTPAGARETWLVENVSAAKVKSTFDQIAVLGRRTEKLIDLFRTRWGFQGLLIKFKLEVGLSDEQLIAVAGASRAASRADLMVANTLAMARPADASQGAAYLIDESSARRVERSQLAAQIAHWVRNRCGLTRP